MASRTPEAVLRKIELIEDLAQAGRKPDTLANQYLTGGRLNGLDLSNVYMRFSSFTKCWLIRTRFVQADLLSADFSDSTLVQADFTGASLVEANFSGALLAGAILAGANVENADFRGARELTREQLTSANNWPNARRDPELVCGEAMPPEEKSLGEKFRAQLRQSSNPAYPYQLGTRVHSDGREETVIIDR